MPDDLPPTDPLDAIDWMNARHAAVNDGSKVLIVYESPDPDAPARWLSYQTLKEHYAYHKVCTRADTNSAAKWVNLAVFWFNHPQRRNLTGGIVFDPTDHTDRNTYYNLWSGFSTQAYQQQQDHPYPYGSWTHMREHIRCVICGCDEDVFDYVIGWLATGVQHPDKPAGVALALRGSEGSGKGIFARSYGRLFGRHWVHLTDARQLTGTFNSHLEDAIVVFADEAVATSDKTTNGKLKGLITEPAFMVEAKYRNAHMAPNRIRVIMASNEDWLVPAGREARRYCVLDVSDAHIDDEEYFAAIEDEMEREGYGAMLKYLNHYDLSKFSITNIPHTIALFDQKVHSLTPAWAWWFERLKEGKLDPTHLLWRTTISRKDTRELYQAALRDAAIAQRTVVQMGMDTQRLLKSVLPPNWPKDGGRVGTDTKWQIPSLKLCREHFESLLGHLIDWDEFAA